MAFARIPALRNLLGTGLRSLRASDQRRWARVHDVRFLATTQPSPTVLEKYREKLAAKARQEGHKDIDELKKAYSDRIHEVRKRDGPLARLPPQPPAPPPPPPPAAAAPTASTQQQQPPPPPPPGPLHPTAAAAAVHAPDSFAKSGVQPLGAILDLPKARALPVRELTAVWRLRHADSPNKLCAVVPAHTYAAMEALARAHPRFVLPVPHPAAGGSEMHFLEWTFDAASATSTVLFTQLADYKARGEYAAPHTTVTHHLDLAADKKVVLMQGQLMPDRGVTPADAQWLVLCLQRFYGGWDGEGKLPVSKERAEERRKLLESFSKGDPTFSVQRLVQEAERLA